MKCTSQELLTPIYLKLGEAMPWPEDESAFHLLTRNGLFLCRNTPFFQSCVPVSAYPSELAGQKPFLKLTYPRIPRSLMERVIGFFDLVGLRYASEAVVLIAWNRHTDAVEAIVPEQVGLVGLSWNDKPYPMELEYQLPSLPPHLLLLGDIHSHVDGPAYSSYLDQSDEVHRPGLHLVVGRILDEPPEFHCEATADGVRFQVNDLSLVLEGYVRRRTNEVPEEWLDKITVKPWNSAKRHSLSPQTGLGFANSSTVLNVQGELEAKPLPSDITPDPQPSRQAGESGQPPTV